MDNLGSYLMLLLLLLNCLPFYCRRRELTLDFETIVFLSILISNWASQGSDTSGPGI